MTTTNRNLKLLIAAIVVSAIAIIPTTSNAADNNTSKYPKSVTFSRAELMNKIKGGWAGQTIGVTYGGPTEFRYLGRTMGDNDHIAWGDIDYVRNTMTNSIGLYDDIYMDLTFVEVFEREGIDAPVESLAKAFAHAGYPLWHANQAARYNILHGIKLVAGYRVLIRDGNDNRYEIPDISRLE